MNGEIIPLLLTSDVPVKLQHTERREPEVAGSCQVVAASSVPDTARSAHVVCVVH